MALHGNPGDGRDFDALLGGQDFLRDVEVLTPARPARGASLGALIDSMREELQRRKPERLLLLGYSWGAYLACSLAQRLGTKPTLLIMVNPFLVDTDGVSGLVKMLSAMPGVGHLLLSRVAISKSGPFIDRCFEPEKAGAAMRETLAAGLRKPDVWRGALRYKDEQHHNPLGVLSESLCDRLVVIRGGSDVVADWESQTKVLAGFESLASDRYTVHSIDGAGHSLLWTHRDEVVNILKAEMEKAGYERYE